MPPWTSANAILLLTLEKLVALTGREDLSKAVGLALHRYADTIRSRGVDMAGWLDAALLFDGPFFEVVIAGPGNALPDAWNRLLPSWAVGAQMASGGPTNEFEKAVPTAAGKHDRNGSALAYVCVHATCKM